MTRARIVALALSAGALAGAGCPEEDPAPPIAPSDVTLEILDFAPNHPFFGWYTLWVRFEPAAGRGLATVPLGLFKADSIGDILILGGGPLRIADDATEVPRHGDGSPDWGRAVDVLVTVEPEIDPEPGPNLPAMLAGDFGGASSPLTTQDPRAIGVDVAQAAGSFVLATPTTASTTDEDEGVWFATPDGSAASLVLPPLVTGWRYQGWVTVPTLGDFSLGSFAAPDGPDGDGAGPVPGGSPAFAFPGSDFPTGQQGNELHTATVSVTLEPPGGADGTKPFFLQVLRRTIVDQAPGVAVPLGRPPDPFPTAVLHVAVAG